MPLSHGQELLFRRRQTWAEGFYPRGDAIEPAIKFMLYHVGPLL